MVKRPQINMDIPSNGDCQEVDDHAGFSLSYLSKKDKIMDTNLGTMPMPTPQRTKPRKHT